MHPGGKKRPSSPSGYVSSAASQTRKKLQGSTRPFLESVSNRRLRIHIIQAKLDNEQLSNIFFIIDSRRRSPTFGLERCAEAQDADVIITAICMRKRLERHIDRDLAVRSPSSRLRSKVLSMIFVLQKREAIVTPQWLYDSAKECKPLPYGDYAALEDIPEETVPNRPDSIDPQSFGSRQFSHTQQPTRINVSRTPPPAAHTLSYKAPLACCRAHPLICPNQELVRELDIIRKSRWLEGEDVSALSYARSIAILKGCCPVGHVGTLSADPHLVKHILSELLNASSGKKSVICPL
jgi:hypothetical protein